MAPPPFPVESSPSSAHTAWLPRLLRVTAPLQVVAIASLAATGLVLATRAGGILQSMELGLYDQQFRLRPDAEVDDRILVVGITETDIQSRQEWPITDKTVTELLQALEQAKPRVIGLDLFRDVPINPGHQALTNYMARSDRLMAVCKMSSPDNPGVAPPAGLPATQIGFSDVVVDGGGILRRSLLLASPPPFNGQLPQEHPCNTPDTQLASLSFQVVLAYLTAENIPITQTDTGNIQLGNTVLKRLQPSSGGYHGINAQGYQIMLNYRSAQSPVPVVSLSDVLSGQVSPDRISDRIVLVGYTTPQAKDDFYTPYSAGLQDSQKMPGVLVHAQAASQLLSAVFDQRPLIWSWPAEGEAIWIFMWSLGGAILAWYVRRPARFLLGALVLVVSLYGLTYGALLLGGWIPLAPPLLSLGLATGGVLLLDRFNRSDYGQAMYRQVKTILRLEVTVDENKVEQQVAEITETDYFNDLQLQAKVLRQKRHQNTTGNTPQTLQTDSTELPTGASPEAQDQSMDEYLAQIQQQARKLQHPSEGATPSDGAPEHEE